MTDKPELLELTEYIAEVKKTDFSIPAVPDDLCGVYGLALGMAKYHPSNDKALMTILIHWDKPGRRTVIEIPPPLSILLYQWFRRCYEAEYRRVFGCDPVISEGKDLP